mgnify:CR=1 FL=1
MMTRVTIDIETDNPKIAAQRSPADDKRRDRRRLQRAILGRYGTHAPKDAIKTTHVRPDGVKQVNRRLTIKRVRAAGKAIGRFYLKYLRDFQDWYFDRQDSDDGSNGR